LGGLQAPKPPPHSWAARADSDVAIWTLKLQAQAQWTLPPAARAGSVRTLYFFKGSQLTLNEHPLKPYQGAVLRSDVPVQLCAGEEEVECLLLQGEPIAEPVVQYGPFVMNTRQEIQNATRGTMAALRGMRTAVWSTLKSRRELVLLWLVGVALRRWTRQAHVSL
jgi:hypothetical protein